MQPITETESGFPMHAMENVSVIETLRDGAHRFVDVFFDGWQNTILYAFGGAVAGVLYPHELQTVICFLSVLIMGGAMFRLCISRSGKHFSGTVLFVARVLIAVFAMGVSTPRDPGSELKAIQEMRRVRDLEKAKQTSPAPLSIDGQHTPARLTSSSTAQDAHIPRQPR